MVTYSLPATPSAPSTNGFMKPLNQMLPPMYSTKPKMNSEIPASGRSGPKMEYRMTMHTPCAGMNARRIHVSTSSTGTKIHTLLTTGLTTGPKSPANHVLTPVVLMNPAMPMSAPMNMTRPQGMRVWKSFGVRMPKADITTAPSSATMPASKMLDIHSARQATTTTSATHSSFFILPRAWYLSMK